MGTDLISLSRWVNSFCKTEMMVLFHHESFVSKKLDGQYKQNEEWEEA